MKKLVVCLAMLASSSVFAHSQTPSSYGGPKNLEEAISVQDYKEVTLTVTNLGKKTTAYDITVDGKVVDTTRELTQWSNQRVTILLPTLVKKKPTTYKVCSQSKGTGSISTKICSKFQLVRL